MRAFAVLLAAACSSPQAQAPRHADVVPTRARLSVDVNGLSGLTRVNRELVSVAERGGMLVRWTTPSRVTAIPITGIPDNHDLEALTYLGNETFAAGTETSADAWRSKSGQSHALILLIRGSSDAMEVVDKVPVPFAIWQLAPDENQGIEGICTADDELITGLETVKVAKGKRLVPMARAPLSDLSAWTPFFLRLTSDSGRLSALECRAKDGFTELFAIERHFGIARLLRYRLRGRGSKAPLEPEIIADFSAFTDRQKLNIEGLTIDAEGNVFMVIDNQWHTISGPSEMLTLSRGT